MISAFSIPAIVFAAVTGVVLAQAPRNNRSTNGTAGAFVRATSIDDCEHPVLGRVLFENVTSVHFCGVTFPANSDGSFGGWVVGVDAGAESKMTIYENYIVKDILLPDGTVFRESRPYDTLGYIEQRIPVSAVKAAEKDRVRRTRP